MLLSFLLQTAPLLENVSSSSSSYIRIYGNPCLGHEQYESLPHLEANAYSLDNMKEEPACQDRGTLGMGAFVEMHDPESCACTEVLGLARTLAFELFHPLMVFDLMLASYNLQFFIINK